MSEIAFDPPAGLPDVSTMDFWTAPREEREAAFAELRAAPGLPKYPERFLEGSPFPPGPGYHAVTRYDDVWQASRNPSSSARGRGRTLSIFPKSSTSSTDR